MGWTVELVGQNGIVNVPRHNAGSIISVNPNGLVGQIEASMCVTYNYSQLYHLAIDASLPDFLNGKQAKDTIDTLKQCVRKLGTNQYKRQVKPGLENTLNTEAYEIDYWCPTPGNAGYIASVLLDWAFLHPNAKWNIFK